jgi:hypothetical protein
MREQTFPYDDRVLDRFPGARSYERGDGVITYLAERGGTPCLLIVPDPPAGKAPVVTVLEFDDEQERATYLTTRDKTTRAST